MWVTFDSNVPSVVLLVSQNVDARSVSWCVSECMCDTPKLDDQNIATLAYDTPISMCRSLGDMPEHFDHHFVYLDFSQPNPSFHRIMSNIRKLKTPCTIITNDRRREGMYYLSTTNVTQMKLAQKIASVVNSFLLTGKLQHPRDIVTQRYGSTRVTRGMIIDVLADHVTDSIIDDCSIMSC